jgi:glycosyltransferase involved in cell wall biosynthesis
MVRYRITIGVTTFNAERTLERVLRSIFAQETPIDEVIIVDDHSTDNTPAVCQELKKTYQSSVIYHRFEKNQGVAESRNKIIELARGDFIVFFDDDDISLPGRVQKQIQAILSYEQKYAQGAPVICHTARTQIFPNGSQKYIGTMGCVPQVTAPHGVQAARGMMFGDPVPGGTGSLATCSQAARTDVYRKLCGFDPTFRRMEDTEFCLRLALAGGHFLGLSEPLVDQYIAFPADKKIDQERQYAAQLINKHREFFLQSGRGDFDKSWLDIRYSFLEKRNIVFICLILKIFIRYPFLTLQKIYRALPNFLIHMRHRIWAHEEQSYGP